jgi:hypothetical protein
MAASIGTPRRKKSLKIPKGYSNSSHDTEYKHAGKIALYYLLKILDGIRYDWLAIFS